MMSLVRKFSFWGVICIVASSCGGGWTVKVLLWIAGIVVSTGFGELIEAGFDRLFRGNEVELCSPLMPGSLSGKLKEPHVKADVVVEIEGRTLSTPIRISRKVLHCERSSSTSIDWRLTQESLNTIEGRLSYGGVQLLLTDMGYDPGRIDGIPGPDTRRAILEFQKTRSDLADTGDLDFETRSVLLGK
ncbi:MAG: peptidoglycan-binding protein [Saprospiraceae bacterium]|nr:peptidoglycan-binding protein [Saprospiraceae bacterium]